MKIKHNKKRNTAFLYNILLRKLSHLVAEQKDTRDIMSLIKEYFSSDKLLGEELKIYNAVLACDDKDEFKNILREAKFQHSLLSQNKIFEEQTNLLFGIEKLLGNDIMSIPIPNYKNIATLNQIFNKRNNIKDKLIFENKLFEETFILKEEKENDEVDKFNFNIYINKFNEKFKNLDENIKKVLNKYILFGIEDVDFKLYLNEELNYLKKTFDELVVENEEIKEGISRIKEKFEEIKKEPISENIISFVIKGRKLIGEINNGN